MVDLTKKLGLLEKHFKDKAFELTAENPPLTMLKDLMPRTLKMKIYFTGNFLLVSIYTHLFNYYESKKNTELSFYYLKKIFVTIIYDVMPYFSKSVNEEVSIFKANVDFIAVPSYELIAHKSLIVLQAVYLRIKHRIRMLKIRYDHTTRMNNPNNTEDEAYKIYFEKLLKCTDLLEECHEVFRRKLTRLSQRYYYAWRICKAQKFITSLLNEEFYAKYSPRYNVEGYNTEMISELEHILQSSLERVREHKKLQKQERKQNKSKAKMNNHVNQPQLRQVPVPLRPARMGSAGSTSSSEDDPTEYKTNTDIDSMWILMINMKNQEGNNALNYATPNFNYDGAIGIPTLSQQNSNLAAAVSGSFLPDGASNVFTPNLQFDMGSLFESIPIDEIFKDLS